MRQDPRIRVITNSSFVGVIENHNIAVRQGSPESRYCKILQADDWLYPEWSRGDGGAGRSPPTAGLVGSYALHGDHVRCDGLPHSSAIVTGRDACRLNLLGRAHLFLSPTVLLIRADLLRAREKYFNEAHLHADSSVLRGAARTDFGFVHQVLSFVRRHQGSLTASRAERFNLLPLSNLELLVQFGPAYLTDAELAQCLRTQSNRYYDSLSRALVRSRDRGRIWQEHAGRMRRSDGR